MWKIKTYIFVYLVCVSFIQCSSNKKGPTIETTRYFTNAGLKYRHFVEITLRPNGSVSGKIYEDEYFGKVDVYSFQGSTVGEKIHVRFSGEKPKVGSACKWIDRPWRIKQKGHKMVLFIPFFSRNYKTQKWENIEYEFEACSVEKANIELKKRFENNEQSRHKNCTCLICIGAMHKGREGTD